MINPVMALERQAVPPVLKQALKQRKTNGVEVIKDDQGNEYVLVMSGPCPTGGYQLVMEGINQEGENWVVDVLCRKPSGERSVVQQITYPYLVLRKLVDDEIKVRVFMEDERKPCLERYLS